MPLHILDHPLAAHIMTHLRDATTKPATFRTLAYQISLRALNEVMHLAKYGCDHGNPIQPILCLILLKSNNFKV
jgi:uracil phosphoribosyltransferase